jgi:hypothetical protein
MNEFDPYAQAIIGDVRAAAARGPAANAIAEQSNPVNTTDRAYFIHSGWRTGKTWFALLFRHFPKLMWFYEPFHEGLATLTAAKAVQLSPGSWPSGHPGAASYWREYVPLIRKTGGVRLYHREMAYDWFISEGGLRGQLRSEELKYLSFLRRYAARRGHVAVFSFARSLGRIHSIRQSLRGTHIVIVRNLWHQWVSFLHQWELGNPYFLYKFLAVIDTADPFFAYLHQCYPKLDALSVSSCDRADGAAQGKRAGEILTTLSDRDIFSIFVAVHVYLYMHGRSCADLLVDTTKLTRDAAYLKDTTARLRELTGLQLSLTDARADIKFTAADPAIIARRDIERHVAVAEKLLPRGEDSHDRREFADELLSELYKKSTTGLPLWAARWQFATATERNEALQVTIGARDARVPAVAAGVAETQAEIAARPEELAALERDRRAAILEQLETEARELRAMAGDRAAAAAAAEERAALAAGEVAELRTTLMGTQQQLAALERHRDERAALLDRLCSENGTAPASLIPRSAKG